jgi:hypothetical protein
MLAMKTLTHYFSIVVLFAVSINLNAQDFFPEKKALKAQEYKLEKIIPSDDSYTLKMDPTDEIIFQENFGDTLTGNPGNGPWTRDGQHGLIWQFDLDGPDGPLIQNGQPLMSTTGDNGFFIFDADAADPAQIGGIDRIGFLVSPVIDMSVNTSAVLQFQQFFNYCCYDFTPLFIGVSNDSGSTWVNIEATPGYTDGANNFSDNPVLTNIDISPYAAGFEQVMIRFGFNPNDFDGFTHYFWAIDDVIIFENPLEFDLAVSDMFMNNVFLDYEYLKIPEAQANDQNFTVIMVNNGAQIQTGVHAVVTVINPLGSPSEFSSDTVTLGPGDRDTLLITTSLVPDDIGLYNCTVEAISDQNADDEIPDNNSLNKSFKTTVNIMAHEHGTFFDGSDGSREDGDNPGTYTEFALGSMFKMQTSAVLDGIQAQIVDSTSVGKTVYPVIYKVVSGGIQGDVVAVSGYSTDAMLDGYTISADDLLGESFNIGLSNTVTLDPDEYYMIALFSEENGQAVYYKTLVDGDSDLSTIRFGLDQFGNDNWFNGYNFTPAIRLNFDIALGFEEKEDSFTDVNAFPNPASSYIDIAFSTRSNEYVSIKIYDISGKLVLNKEIGNIPSGEQRIRLNLNALNAGLYFYDLQQGDVIKTNKFIVK